MLIFPHLAGRTQERSPGAWPQPPGSETQLLHLQFQLDCRGGFLGLRYGLGVLAGVVQRLVGLVVFLLGFIIVLVWLYQLWSARLRGHRLLHDALIVASSP